MKDIILTRFGNDARITGVNMVLTIYVNWPTKLIVSQINNDILINRFRRQLVTVSHSILVWLQFNDIDTIMWNKYLDFNLMQT